MISKTDLEKVLLEWKEFKLPEIRERELKLDLNPEQIISLTGIRRSGKTFILLDTAKKLLRRYKRGEVLYVNFEHELLVNIEAKDARKMFEIHGELFEERIRYLLFDEIQKVRNWEVLLRRLYDERRYRIFISGSSSEVRPKELSSSLRGRTLNFMVFPLNFREFLKFKNHEFGNKDDLVEEKKGKMLKLLREYLEFGGFPDVVLKEDRIEKIKLISSYFDTILLRDIIEKHEIRHVRLLEMFLKYIISTSSCYFSPTKAQNYFKSIGEKCTKPTLLDFLEYAEKAFLVFKTEIFSPKIKDRKQYPVKIYTIDNSFINFVNPKFSENIGVLMENCVGIEFLRRKEKDPTIEIYYWKNHQGREVDFVVKKGFEIHELVQVSYALNENDVRRRETKSLIKASEELGCKNLLVITWDYEGEEKAKGKEIRFIPLWKWLLRSHNL